MQQAHLNVPNVQLTSSLIQIPTFAVPAQLDNSETLIMSAPIVMIIVSLAVPMVQTFRITNVSAILLITSLLLTPKNVLMTAQIIITRTAYIVTVSIMFLSNQLYR